MGDFQKTILMIAVVILIIVLLIIGIALMNAQSSPVWPPNVPDCPDWWIADGSGAALKCINAKDLGICNEKEKNFGAAQFSGTNGLCNKYKWATRCKVAWDGITYGVTDPCN
jgi:hypothetical protein